jgi:hypothetical protein
MSFSRSRQIKASRKERRCDHCRQTIGVGEPYLYICWHEEGELGDCHVHSECHAFVTAYTCTDDGFSFLDDFDPSDEYELAEDILAKPPTPEMLARLPPRWREAVDEILANSAAASAPSHSQPQA